ncbi:MAG: class I SAM-dependent methyltransferase [Acidimicrobiia bacterium]
MPVDLQRLLDGIGLRAGPDVAGHPRLNLGSGTDSLAGFVNLDLVPVPGVDVVASLGSAPLPFPDDTFGVVLCRDVLEHVDVVAALREVHRLTVPGGLVLISTVHFTSRNLYVDPTHVRGYSVRTLDFFAGAGEERWRRPYYFDFMFGAVEYAAIQFHTTLGKGRLFVWDRLVEPCVNASRATQDLYEMTFLSRLAPAANVVAILRK